MATLLLMTVLSSQIGFLSADRKAGLYAEFVASYQKGAGGFDPAKKSLDAVSVELALRLAARGSDRGAGMAQKTLLKNTFLLDREAGGVFDYSVVRTGRDPWRSPVRTKSPRTQAINLYLYSLAHAQFGGWRYLDAASVVYAHVEGQPVEAAWTVRALATYHRVTGQRAPLMKALAGAEELLDACGPTEGHALLDLFEATRDATWLGRAERCALVLQREFQQTSDPETLGNIGRFGIRLRSLTQSDAASFLTLGTIAMLTRTSDARAAIILLVNEEYRGDPSWRVAGQTKVVSSRREPTAD